MILQYIASFVFKNVKIFQIFARKDPSLKLMIVSTTYILIHTNSFGYFTQKYAFFSFALFSLKMYTDQATNQSQISTPHVYFSGLTTLCTHMLSDLL